MINDFNLDYMHMVCLGVVRRMLYYLKGHFKSVFNGRLSQSSLNEITSRLLLFKGKLPSEFSKQPRSLNELDRQKATERRSFLLYTGPIALKGILSSSYNKHFLSLFYRSEFYVMIMKGNVMFYLNLQKSSSIILFATVRNIMVIHSVFTMFMDQFILQMMLSISKNHFRQYQYLHLKITCKN